MKSMNSRTSFNKLLDHGEKQTCCNNLEMLSLDNNRAAIMKRVNDRTLEKDDLYFKCQEQSPIEMHFEKGETKLKDLASFGKELITNINVSTEKYELLRRHAEEIRKNDLDERISDESKITLAKFDEILARWSELTDVKEPMALFEELEALKKNVAELMDSKKTIIDCCQDEYKRLTEQYQADQARHEISMCFLVERIDNHVEIMNNAYKEQIDTLALALNDERKQNILDSVAEWHDVFDKTMQIQNEKLLLHRKKRDYYANEIKRITRTQEEMTHATRVRLEKDAELLQLELRTAHNNALLNSEKLDYNYNVLQNSSLEKTVILNQQKRRIAKLTEHIVQIKKQINEQKIRSEAQLIKAVADIEKLHSNISHLEEKGHGLQKHQSDQYKRCWDMNYNEAVTLIEKIYTIDKTIHEQQLLVPWSPLKIESTYIPLKHTQQFLKTSRSSTKGDILKKCQVKKQRNITEVFIGEAETRLIRHVLRTMPDRSTFLVELPLHTILESYSDKQKNVIKIDSVFSALKIYNIKDMRAMASHFKAYMFCPNCTKKVSDDVLNTAFGDRYFFEDEATLNDKDCPNHYLVMNPSIVLTALNEFMEYHREKIEADEYYSAPPADSYPDRNSPILNMSQKEIEDFWTKLVSNVPKSRNNLWKGVEHGLNHYMEILRKREELFKECNMLKRQNFELKHFLKRFY